MLDLMPESTLTTTSVFGSPAFATHCTLIEDLDADAANIKVLDLGVYESVIKYTWKTGRLPPILRKFTSLQVLHAEALGVIVVDEWIVELKHLKEIYLSGNEITTWPQHLVLLPELEVLTMEATPCLEQQFRKSSSFRDSFFVSKRFVDNAHKHLPNIIRGPEWAAAIQKRALSNLIGIYCGGIYSMTTTATKAKEDDYLTTMGTSRLEARVTAPPPLLIKPAATTPEKHNDHDENQKDERMRRSRLLMGLLRGIVHLSGKYCVGAQISAIPVIIENSRYCLGQDRLQLKSVLTRFITEEHRFSLCLQETLQIFLSPNIPSSYAKSLALIFDSFPEIYIIHTRSLMKIFKKTLRQIDCHKDIGLAKLCNSVLDLFRNNQFRCYEEYALGYTNAQWRLWRYLNPEMHFDDELSGNTGRVGEWLYKEAMDNPYHSLEHAVSYLDLPLLQLSNCCEFFKHLSRAYSACEPVYDKFHHLYGHVKEIIEESRRSLRINRLCQHYKISLKDRHQFSLYQWDVLLSINSRLFLEEGLHKYKANDVLVTRENHPLAMSVVSEIFSHGERSLRIICCQNELRIWDETIGKMVGALGPTDLVIREESDGLRVTFLSLDETCKCTVLSFANVEIGERGDHAFANALSATQERTRKRRHSTAKSI